MNQNDKSFFCGKEKSNFGVSNIQNLGIGYFFYSMGLYISSGGSCLKNGVCRKRLWSQKDWPKYSLHNQLEATVLKYKGVVMCGNPL